MILASQRDNGLKTGLGLHPSLKEQFQMIHSLAMIFGISRTPNIVLAQLNPINETGYNEFHQSAAKALP